MLDDLLSGRLKSVRGNPRPYLKINEVKLKTAKYESWLYWMGNSSVNRDIVWRFFTLLLLCAKSR